MSTQAESSINGRHVLLIHAREDYGVVHEIAARLRAAGVSPVSYQDAHHGRPVLQNIERLLVEASLAVAFLSRPFLDSPYCEGEVVAAFEDRKLLLVYLAPCEGDAPKVLKSCFSLEYYGDRSKRDEALEHLVAAVRARLGLIESVEPAGSTPRPRTHVRRVSIPRLRNAVVGTVLAVVAAYACFDRIGSKRLLRECELLATRYAKSRDVASSETEPPDPVERVSEDADSPEDVVRRQLPHAVRYLMENRPEVCLRMLEVIKSGLPHSHEGVHVVKADIQRLRVFGHLYMDNLEAARESFEAAKDLAPDAERDGEIEDLLAKWGTSISPRDLDSILDDMERENADGPVRIREGVSLVRAELHLERAKKHDAAGDSIAAARCRGEADDRLGELSVLGFPPATESARGRTGASRREEPRRSDEVGEGSGAVADDLLEKFHDRRLMTVQKSLPPRGSRGNAPPGEER